MATAATTDALQIQAEQARQKGKYADLYARTRKLESSDRAHEYYRKAHTKALAELETSLRVLLALTFINLAIALAALIAAFAN